MFVAQNGFGYQGLPQWLISLIIMCSCATLCVFMLIVNRLVRFFHMRSVGEVLCLTPFRKCLFWHSSFPPF